MALQEKTTATSNVMAPSEMHLLSSRGLHVRVRTNTSLRVTAERQLCSPRPLMWCCFLRDCLPWLLAAAVVVIVAEGGHAREDIQALGCGEPIVEQTVQLAVKDEEQMAMQEEDDVQREEDMEVTRKEDWKMMKEEEEEEEDYDDYDEMEVENNSNMDDGEHGEQEQKQGRSRRKRHEQQRQKRTTEGEGNAIEGTTSDRKLREDARQHKIYIEKEKEKEKVKDEEDDDDSRTAQILKAILTDDYENLDPLSTLVVIVLSGFVIFLGYAILGTDIL